MADDYVAKIQKIRDRLRKDHEDAVAGAKPGNPVERREIVRTYEEYEAFARIVAAEEERRSELTRLAERTEGSQSG